MKESSLRKPEGTWAIEAFDFLRLFRRVGKSFLGLLLLQIGWTVYILLLDKIIGANPNPASTAIPLWPRSALRLPLAFSSNTFLVVGSILIVVGWVFYSGFYQYLVALIWNILEPLIFLLMIVLAIIVFLLNVILLPVTWPVEIQSIKRWKKNNKDKFEKLKLSAIKELGQLEGESKKPNAQHKELIKRTVDKQIREKLPHDKWVLMSTVGGAASTILMRMYSFGHIGFAPLASYSYEEDLQAAKVPVQIFAWAISKIRIQLRGLEALNWIRFKFLPVHFLVTTPEKAEFIRRLFKLDVLLWGSYSTGEEGRIWLNIQQRLKVQSADSHNSDESAADSVELFPLSLQLDAPAVTLSQDDPEEAHTLLLVVIILILQNRWNTRQDSNFRNFDRLYFLHHKLPEILNKLVYDTFLSITEKRLATNDFLPATNVVLTAIVGQWVGYQLNKRASSALTERSIDHLQAIARRCAELVPDRPEHFYRLGAYKSLAGDKAGVRDSFRKAGVLETKGREVDPVMDQAMFDIGLDEASSEVGIKRRFALARAAAYAARALNNRNDYTITNLKEKLDEHKVLDFDNDSFEWSLIKELIDAESKKGP